MILIGLSSLPFLNELVTNTDGSLLYWLASPEIQASWADENGRILGYSKLRVLLYFLFVQTYVLISSLGWYSVAKGKDYRNAILLCTASSAYHIMVILTESRKTAINGADIKFWLTLGLATVLFTGFIVAKYKRMRKLSLVYTTFGINRKNLLSAKTLLSWFALLLVSILPYMHDIISPRGMGVQDWVPFQGLEHLVKLEDGNYWGFASYRALVLSLFVLLYAQISWAGWFIDARYNLYKPFLLVPLGLSLYELIVLLTVRTDTYLNKPDIKLVAVLLLGVAIGMLYYFKNKHLPKRTETLDSVLDKMNKNQNLNSNEV